MAKFPTYDEMAKRVAEMALDEFLYDGRSIREWIQIIAAEDCIRRQAAIDAMVKIEHDDIVQYGCAIPEGFNSDPAIEALNELPPITPRPKTYISIDDVMSAFDDFMRGEVDENDTETFLEMLKDRAEREK